MCIARATSAASSGSGSCWASPWAKCSEPLVELQPGAFDQPAHAGRVTGVDVDHLGPRGGQHELEPTETAAEVRDGVTGTDGHGMEGPRVLKSPGGVVVGLEPEGPTARAWRGSTLSRRPSLKAA